MAAKITTDRERHGLVFTPDHIEEHASAVLLAKDIADNLEKQYSGWLWALGVDAQGGVVSIRSLRLSMEWGVMLKLDEIQHDPKVRQREVMRAAGEILERFGCKPGHYRHDMVANIRRDIAGRPMPDLSDKHTKIRKRYRDEALTTAVQNGSVHVSVKDRARRDGSTYRQILIASGAKTRDVQG